MDSHEQSLLSEASKFVFEALMKEAVDLVSRKIAIGQKPSSAVCEVANELSLNHFEADELVGRVKKQASKPKIEPEIDMEPIGESTIKPLSIYFENSDQLNQATQVLMDKSTAWLSKGLDESKPYIQFANEEELAEAKSALRRRWDFVENQKRLVADIQFDNLHDYSKVLEFMRRQGILLEFDDGIELDEDYDEVQNQIDVQRKLAEKEGRTFEEHNDDLQSFMARPRDIHGNARVDPLRETKYRVARARKRWK